MNERRFMAQLARHHLNRGDGRPQPGPAAPGPQQIVHGPADNSTFGRDLNQGFSAVSYGGHRSGSLVPHRGIGVRGVTVSGS